MGTICGPDKIKMKGNWIKSKLKIVKKVQLNRFWKYCSNILWYVFYKNNNNNSTEADKTYCHKEKGYTGSVSVLLSVNECLHF